MNVEIIKCLKDNYSYLVIDEKNQSACVIDPSEAKPIINFIEKNKIHLKFILNTHHHYDHVGGNKELKKKYNTKIIGFEEDKDRMHDKKNLKLKEKILLIKEKLNKNLPTVPSTLKEELETNIFLKCDSIETFSKLRNLKDNF